jgi:hypothetical protein
MEQKIAKAAKKQDFDCLLGDLCDLLFRIPPPRR